MSYFLGIDTSNYTTSVAKYDPQSSTIRHSKKLLPVRAGELGLRQSDALFHHVRQLNEVLHEVVDSENGLPEAVCASDRPRSLPDSYMPCFLVGRTVGESIAAVVHRPFYTTSHQAGHLMAALYSAGRLDLVEREFIGFHVSGGTFEVLHVTPDPETVFAAQIVAHTLDISAGQLIDRLGQRLELGFPGGPKVEALAKEGHWNGKLHPTFREGNCCLSGMENKMDQLLSEGTDPRDVCRFLLDYISQVLITMAEDATKEFGPLPLVFSGGVMSNTLLREAVGRGRDSSFAQPEFSADNAAGVAVLCGVLHQRRKGA